jgi:hypothetical protein
MELKIADKRENHGNGIKWDQVRRNKNSASPKKLKPRYPNARFMMEYH